MNKPNKPTEYAIVDIETTGGYASGSGITEIAILIHDGHSVIDRYETLINPQKDIPLPIFSLTGINNEMVRHSPVFADIAAQVYTLLQGRVFVAHSVNFDYSFVKHHLEQAGYPFSAPKLCTVRMSRMIKPGYRSYSLGHLCAALNIPIANRHRAGGDADATAILFTKLLAWDTDGHIPRMLKKGSKEEQLPPNLPREDFDNLPGCPGVYYFRDKAGKVIYVGKAVHIKKRVASHFTGHNPNPQRQHFLRNIYSITYEICGTELMAFLLECAEIKRLWPAYNRALKRFEPKFGLLAYEDLNGYMRLAVGKLNKHTQCTHVFNREYDAVKFLRGLIEQYDLCPDLCSFGPSVSREARDPGADPGIAGDRTSLHYNHQVREALEQYSENLPSFAIIDRGRHGAEQSIIWIEKGSFYGMGYRDSHSDLHTPEELKESLTLYPGNHYMTQLIHTYAEKNPGKVLRFDRHMAEIRDSDGYSDEAHTDFRSL